MIPATAAPSVSGQQPPKPPKVLKVPKGCLTLIAIPFGIFGVFRALAVLDAFSPFDIVRLYWNVVGTVVGLGVPYLLLKVNKREPTEEEIRRATSVRGYMPFGCYATIGGFFLVVGIGMMLTAVSMFVAGDTDNAFGFGAFAAMMILIGSWFIVGGRLETLRDGPLREALARNDPEPWRYAAQWTDGKARHKGLKGATGKYLFALLWNAMTWPVVLPIVTGSDDPMRFLFLIFPGVGVLAALGAIRSLRAGLTFGETVFTMETFPGTVGGRLAGVVQTRITSAMARDVDFGATLRCARRTRRTSRGGPDYQFQPLWETSATIPHRVFKDARGETVALRIDIPIPSDAHPTTLHDASDCIVWFLHIAGNTSDTPFAAEMEVPIFDLRNAEERTAAEPKLEQLAAEVRAKVPAPPSLTRIIFPSPDARFAIDDQHGGLIRVTSESGDQTRSRIGVVLIALGVFGLISVLKLPEGQVPNGTGLIPVVAIFAGVFLRFFYYRYTKSELELRTTDLTVRSRTVANGEAIFSYDELEGADVQEGGERRTTRGAVVTHLVVEHDIVLSRSGGKETALGLRVTERKQADWLATTIRQRIARARAAAGR